MRRASPQSGVEEPTPRDNSEDARRLHLTIDATSVFQPTPDQIEGMLRGQWGEARLDASGDGHVVGEWRRGGRRVVRMTSTGVPEKATRNGSELLDIDAVVEVFLAFARGAGIDGLAEWGSLIPPQSVVGDTAITERVTCPVCCSSLPVAEVLGACSVSWPFKDLASFMCPACEMFAHVELRSGKLVTGRLDGGPGPCFFPHDQIELNDLIVDRDDRELRCSYAGRRYVIRTRD